MTGETSTLYPWCERPFRARRGGSPQRFCGSKCRATFWSALRRWGERAVAAGILTIAEIRNGDPTACTVLQGAISPAPEVTRADSPYTRQQDLERLMAQAISLRRRG